MRQTESSPQMAVKSPFPITCAVAITTLVLFIHSPLFLTQGGQGNPENGKRLYHENCAECHGRNGDGTGAVGKLLATPPADFLSRTSRSKTDQKLFRIIQEGKRFDEMHSWSEELTPQEIWDVVRHIRTLAPPITSTQ